MKALLLTLCLLVWCASFAPAQKSESRAREPQSNQATQTELTAAEAAELNEAARLTEQAVNLYNDGKYAEALPLAKTALATVKKIYGPEHHSVAAASRTLAEIYLAQKKWTDAGPLFQSALKIYEQTLGAENPLLSEILERLALVYFSQSDYSKTEQAYLRALSIREKSFGAEHALVATSLVKLADFYQVTGQYKKAEPVFARLVPMREKLFGAKSKELAEALDRYSCLMHRTNRGEEAKKLEERVLGIYSADGTPEMIFENPESLNEKAIKLPRPYYPAEARRLRITGTVTVRVIVNENGKVIFACGTGGNPLLIQASEWAAYQAVFKPATIAGKVVKERGNIIYRFGF